jgi:hypothetical protein
MRKRERGERMRERDYICGRGECLDDVRGEEENLA